MVKIYKAQFTCTNAKEISIPYLVSWIKNPCSKKFLPNNCELCENLIGWSYGLNWHNSVKHQQFSCCVWWWKVMKKKEFYDLINFIFWQPECAPYSTRNKVIKFNLLLNFDFPFKVTLYGTGANLKFANLRWMTRF